MAGFEPSPLLYLNISISLSISISTQTYWGALIVNYDSTGVVTTTFVVLLRLHSFKFWLQSVFKIFSLNLLNIFSSPIYVRGSTHFLCTWFHSLTTEAECLSFFLSANCLSLYLTEPFSLTYLAVFLFVSPSFQHVLYTLSHTHPHTRTYLFVTQCLGWNKRSPFFAQKCCF